MLRFRFLRCLILGLAAAAAIGCDYAGPPQETAAPDSTTAATANPLKPATPQDPAPDRDEPSVAENTDAQTEPAEGDQAATETEPAVAQEPEDKTRELLNRAITAARSGEFDQALGLVRKAAALAPDDPAIQLLLGQFVFVRARQLMAQGKSEEGHKLAHEAVALARKLTAQASEDAADSPHQDLLQAALVFEALAFVQENKPEEAKKALRAAVEAGLFNIEALTNDPELKDLKKLPEFEKFLTELKKLAQAALTNEIKQLVAAQKPFPFDFTLTDLNGKPLKLADYRGKVVLVDIWGTWCPPCRASIPHLVRLHEEFRDKGFSVIGLAYEGAETEEQLEEAKKVVQAFVTQHKVSYPVALGDEKTQQSIPNFQGYPTMIFLDREGTVKLVLVGYKPYEYLKAVVEHLLAAEQQQPVSSSLPAASWLGLALAALPTQDAAQQDQDEPQDARSLQLKLSLLIRQGKLDQAVKLAAKAHKNAPEDSELAQLYARILMTQAQVQMRQNKAKAAIKSLQTAADVLEALEPQTGQERANRSILLQLCYVQLARLHAQQQATKKAATALLKALDAGFTNVDYLDSDPLLKQVANDPKVAQRIDQLRKQQEEMYRRLADQELAKGVTFDFDFELPDVEGKPVKLADFKGKVVIVDIWGTWCPPCRREVPHFIELYKKYKDKGLAVVGINFERVPEDQVVPTIKKFIAEFGINYPCLIGERSILQQVPEFRGYPTTLFIDRTGKVRAKVVGYRPMAFLEAMVTALLAEEVQQAAK